MESTDLSLVKTTLTFSREEQEELLAVLKQALEDTRFEAERTDSHGYRQQVRREEAVLRGLVAKLTPGQPKEV